MTATVQAPTRPGLLRAVGWWFARYLARLGHVWYENPKSLITFLPRLARATDQILSDFAPARLRRTLWDIAQQTNQAFFRGFFVVLALGIVVGMGIGVVARTVGSLLQPTFEAVVVTAFVRDAAPLLLALFLSSRVGASIAAHVASSLPEGRPGRLVTSGELSHLVVPRFVATLFTSGIFFLVLAQCLIQGYLSFGTFGRLFQVDRAWYFSLPATREALLLGVWKSVLFGGVIAYVSAALGVQARERARSDDDRVQQVQNAVWESAVTALMICTALTVIFWNFVEEPLG